MTLIGLKELRHGLHIVKSSEFVKFVVGNPFQSFTSLTILVPVWFIIIASMSFFILVNYYFEDSLNLKVILYVAKITRNAVTEFL